MAYSDFTIGDVKTRPGLERIVGILCRRVEGGPRPAPARPGPARPGPAGEAA